ncbi:MAG: hypothetical protein D6754_06990, partial [Alphaproteobacteria bacterium]
MSIAVTDGATGRRYPALAALISLVTFATLQALALWRTGGAFEYPLDDVYIHLSMAAQIVKGGYGVNDGEYASAASSILYPLLLTPFSETGFHRYLPLIWNTAAVIAAGWLWGMVVARAAGADSRLRMLMTLVALIGPLAFNIAGIGVTGMEHALHVAATLAVLVGLERFLREGVVGWLLIAGILAGPMLRFEGLAISGLACMVLLFSGRPATAVLAGLGALLPVAVFAWVMTSIGLDPMPNSVQAKLLAAMPGVADRPLLRQFVVLIHNLAQPPGLAIGLMTLFWLGAGLFAPRLRRPPAAWMWRVLVGAGAAHLVFGQIGWLDRYEIYVVVWIAGWSLILAAPWMARAGLAGPLARIATVAALFAGSFHYLVDMSLRGPLGARSIHLQQYQMARFAKDYVRAPVAVNDLGWVAYRNPHYVLDLWGLASREALATRLTDPGPGWAGPL